MNITKNVATFASRKEKPWHDIGTIVEEAMTSEEALKLGGLDFEVAKRQVEVPVIIETGEQDEFNEDIVTEEYKPVPNTHAIIRTDNNIILGTCTDRYEIVQNHEAFNFFDNVVGEGKAIFETVGSLGNGEIVFITAKLPEPLLLDKDDVIDDYLVLATSHDSSLAVTVFFTKIRVCCSNTLSAALNGAKNKISIKHTKTVKERMDISSRLLGYNIDYNSKLLDNLNRFKQMNIKDIDVDKMIYLLILTPEEYNIALKYNGNLSMTSDISTKKKNVIAELRKTIYRGVGQDKYVGTALWFFNGVSCYMNNVKQFKSDDDKFQSIVTENVLLTQTYGLIDEYFKNIKE